MNPYRLKIVQSLNILVFFSFLFQVPNGVGRKTKCPIFSYWVPVNAEWTLVCPTILTPDLKPTGQRVLGALERHLLPFFPVQV